MNILIAGGTSFVGRAITHAAVAAGHTVTVLNRGKTPSDVPTSVLRLVGDRHGDLSALDGRTFDATIDTVAYQRRDVETLASALGGRGGHYLQISSISAYDDPRERAGTESTPLQELGDIDPNADVTGATYGPLKAECERAAQELFSSVAVVRPSYVFGAFDKTFRFPYWVDRLARGGDVAFPGPGSNALQWIDARDLAQLVLTLTEQQWTGAVHACGEFPAISYRTMLERVAQVVAPAGTTLHEVDPSRLSDHSWYQKFPLWNGDESAPVMDMDNSLAVSLGMPLTTLEETTQETAEWLQTVARPEWWFSADAEAELLRD
jgi:2'-hydroxyisoflavone reductase